MGDVDQHEGVARVWHMRFQTDMPGPQAGADAVAERRAAHRFRRLAQNIEQLGAGDAAGIGVDVEVGRTGGDDLHQGFKVVV